MARFLVLSNHHHLLPLGHRLRLEDHDVEMVIWRGGHGQRFDKAWASAFPKFLQHSDAQFKDKVDKLVELAREGEIIVVTDSYNATKVFKESLHLYGAIHTDRAPVSRLRLGGWMDGTSFEAKHMLVVDEGTWPGGIGPRQPGAMTLVRIDNDAALDLYDKVVKDLTGMLAGFKGLVQVGLDLNTASGEPEVAGISIGWPMLHSHAFLSESPGISRVLGGWEPTPVLERKFVTVLPVSMPPWPSKGHPAREVEIEGLTPQQMGRVFWHDADFNSETRKARTAGLDGLVGVVRGAADTPELARAKALELAQRLELPEKQYRFDGAEGVSGALSGLEAALGITL